MSVCACMRALTGACTAGFFVDVYVVNVMYTERGQQWLEIQPLQQHTVVSINVLYLRKDSCYKAQREPRTGKFTTHETMNMH